MAGKKRHSKDGGDGAEGKGVMFSHLSAFLPEIARLETRVIWALGRNPHPDAPFVLHEFYCPELDCDCDLVMLSVFDARNPLAGSLISMTYSFRGELRSEDRPLIEETNPMTETGRQLLPSILRLFDTDPDFVKGLKRHYDLVKAFQRGKTDLRKRSARHLTVLEPMGGDGAESPVRH